MTWEQQAEWQPLSWDHDDLAFALAIIQEANEIMAKAHTGADFLLANDDFQQAMQANIDHIYAAIKDHKERQRDIRIELLW